MCPPASGRLKIEVQKMSQFWSYFCCFSVPKVCEWPLSKYIRPGYNHTVLGGAFCSLFGPFWAIFGPFQSDFSCQSKRLGPVWSQFHTFISYSKLLEWPEIRCNGPDNDHMVPLGAFKGHFWTFWSDFSSQSKRMEFVAASFFGHYRSQLVFNKLLINSHIVEGKTFF